MHTADEYRTAITWVRGTGVSNPEIIKRIARDKLAGEEKSLKNKKKLSPQELGTLSTISQRGGDPDD